MSWLIEPQEVLNSSPIVPVMVIKDVEDAVPMAAALLEGGISVFEITLRTEAALGAISAISKAFPDALVGAGTVLTPAQYDAAVEAGATFVISPGFTPKLLEHAAKGPAPILPGVSTPSEIMLAAEMGYTYLKFFPAEANGGAAALKAISAPLADIRFCPTGGINPDNMMKYLNLPCVAAIGGSWMLPADAIRDKNWQHITTLTKNALAMIG